MLHVFLYGLEVARYALLYRVLFDKKVSKVWCFFGVGAILNLFYIFFGEGLPNSAKCVYACIATFIAMFLMMKEEWKKKGKALLILFLVISVLTKVILLPIKLLEVHDIIQRDLNDYESVFTSIVTIVLVSGMLLWKKKRKEKKVWDLSGTKIYIVVVIMIIGMLITASALDVAVQYVPSRRFSTLAVILVAVTYASIGMLGVFVTHIRNVNAKMEGMLQNEISLKEMQRSYYESLLEKEEDTRKYRHDMSNHLLCLNHFLEQNRVEELADYLKEMQEQLSQIQKKCYVTGNQVLDAITNHYLAQEDEFTKVKVTGRVSEELPCDRFSLCTIYANLLKNAIEELERVERTNKKLEIEFSQGEIFFQIELCNSIADKSKGKKQLFLTEKEDKRNHGLGIKNVKKVVKECGGEVFFEKRDEVFCVKVLLKNDRSRT